MSNSGAKNTATLQHRRGQRRARGPNSQVPAESSKRHKPKVRPGPGDEAPSRRPYRQAVTRAAAPRGGRYCARACRRAASPEATSRLPAVAGEWPSGPFEADAPVELEFYVGIVGRLIQVCGTEGKRGQGGPDIARDAKLSNQTVYNILQGKSWCELLTIYRLEKALNAQFGTTNTSRGRRTPSGPGGGAARRCARTPGERDAQIRTGRCRVRRGSGQPAPDPALRRQHHGTATTHRQRHHGHSSVLGHERYC